MKEFWNSLLTEKSWNLLQELRKKYDFIIIGGWAVYLWTKQLKSKDIDFVVDIDELQKLKQERLIKNERLRKYELKFDEIDVDIYVAHFSRLAIPAESMKDYCCENDGFKVVCPEVLLILKQSAEIDRRNSIKGEKDKIDMMSLLFLVDIDFGKYLKILKKYSLENYFSELIRFIKLFKDYGVLNLNPREFSLKKRKLIEELKKLK